MTISFESARLHPRLLFHDRLATAMENALRAGDRLAVACLVDPEPDDLARSLPWLAHRAGVSMRREGKRFVLVEAGDAETPSFEQIVDYALEPDLIAPGIGIAIFPEHGDGPDGLCHAAWLATRNGAGAPPGGRAATLGESPLAEGDTRLWDLHYQPQVDLRTGLVTAAEALARSPGSTSYPALGWYRGATIEEERAFGVWVIERAVRDLRRWRATRVRQLRIAINLSLEAAQSPDLIGRVAKVLQESGLPPASLEIELTEQRPCLDHGPAIASLERLRALGVRLALDDFGTGFASLTRFNELPLDTVKIDHSFIAGLARGGDRADVEWLVRDVIGLARSRDLRVVAEGVEHEVQLALLRQLGCDAYQGYFFSPPLPAPALFELISDNPVTEPAPEP